MKEPLSRNQRLVWRVVLLQTCSAFAVSGLCWGFADFRAALAALYGGLITAVGTALFGWRLFGPGIAGGVTIKRALMAGETLKWFWLICALWLGFTKLALAPLPLIAGLAVAQFGYWFGLVVGSKRGMAGNGSG